MFADAVRLPFSFDPRELQRDLSLAVETTWTDHFVKANYEGSWSAIALRGPADARHPIQAIYSDPTCTDFADMPVLSRCAHFQSVLRSFHCPLQAVRLMRLGPGSVIKEHHDHDLDVTQGHARIHIPIVTNDGVAFRLNGRRVTMLEGECWYLRLSDPHSVRNDGDTDRVHLVIDAIADAWLTDLIGATVPSAP